MAEVQLLGLFPQAASTAEAIAQLRQLGVPDEKITVMSGVPYKPSILGRPRPRTALGRLTLTGTGLGLLAALFLTVGIYLLSSLNQGGQPLIPIPPSLIIFFEVAMLGTMGLTFVGLFFVNRFPILKPHLYDPRITEGAIGIAANLDEDLLRQAENIFTTCGAFDCVRAKTDPPRDSRNGLFWATVGVVLVAGAAGLMLWAYDVIKIEIPDQMVEQPSIDYNQGPRLAAPAAAVPIQGSELIAGQPASTPVPPTSGSLQRGQVLFNFHCTVCHGASGAGAGVLSGFFTAVKPADLTSLTVQSRSSEQLFVVLTQGVGFMPPFAENLTVSERWDVINHIRTLKK